MQSRRSNFSFSIGILLIGILFCCKNTHALMGWSHSMCYQFKTGFTHIRPSHGYRSVRRCSSFRRLSGLSMGLQIKIRIVGRKNGSEKWLEDAYSMYETRLRPSNIDVETVWHKNDQDLIKGINTDKTKGLSVVLLDPGGKARTSEQFSQDMYNWLDEGGSRLAFVIGGAEGLPSDLLYAEKGSSTSPMFSLSSLTFTHQFARTLLMEQIYRASEIRKGSGYHK